MKDLEFKSIMKLFCKICDCNDIYRVLTEISSAYNPPLITSIDNLFEYAVKLANNAEIYIAKDELLLGFIAFYSNDVINKIGYITQLGVMPKAQSIGIGSKLMNISYTICKEKGMKKIKLEVRKMNTRAIRFYQKEGFRFCGEASDRSIYMEKSI